MVRSYKDAELLERAEYTKGFEGFPTSYWILAVRSDEDVMSFDDKFYIFKGTYFVMVMSGTTNKGNKGTAVLCSNQWTYDCYAPTNGTTVRHHRGLMRALRQVKGIPYSRDYSKDGKTNPTTEIQSNIIHTNFHACTYDMTTTVKKKHIAGWSEGCLVVNDIPKYNYFLDTVKNQKSLSLCLIEEF